MPFLDWKELEDRNRLAFIEAGATMCLRHAQALTTRPAYETIAQDNLARCAKALRRALIDVRRAQAIYARKRAEA
jgi:hypothetical protein